MSRGLLRTMIALPALAAVPLVAPSTVAAQTRPPVLTGVSPYGLQRGTTVAFTVEGANLEGADAVLFTHEGLTARIDGYEDRGADIRERRPGETGAIIQDRARKGSLRLTVSATVDVPAGRHGFRVHTPLGTTSFMPLWVGGLPERQEHEPDDEPAQATEATTPLTINGVLMEDGDVDHVRVHARAGHDLVVEVVATSLGSQLDAMLTLLDEQGRELASNDDFHNRRDSLILYRPRTDGTVIVRIEDALRSGGGRHLYRLTIGEVPYVTRTYPLGRPADLAGARVQVFGANLGGAPAAVAGEPRPDAPGRAPVRIAGLEAEPLNHAAIALGAYPEIEEREGNDSVAQAQVLRAPVTVNGTVHRDRSSAGTAGTLTDRRADADLFKLSARKGETLVIEVDAERLGSPLDSVLEILDASGKAVPRAVLRPVWATTVDLRNHDSTGTGLRLLAWDQLDRGDFVYVDRELLRVDELPKGPDEDTRFAQFRGRRISFEDTTPEAHALLRPVYKVEVHPPGSTFSPNGLPVFQLPYRNDDGGPLAGRDSRLTFTAPAGGEYFVRLTDARGEEGEGYAYRLTLAPPAPDFELFVSPSNPNVPRGGRMPITVFALRRDGFEGPIDVRITGLPAGVTATAGTLAATENAVTLTLSAEAAAADVVAPLLVEGRARIEGRDVVRAARPDEPVSVISTATPPDVRVVAVTPDVIELAPGGRARVTATIERANGFAGRVPLSVNNLPFRVTVPDIGLNGILITEDQASRSFEIVADEGATPSERTLFVTARVETNGGTSSLHSSTPITIRIVQEGRPSVRPLPSNHEPRSIR